MNGKPSGKQDQTQIPDGKGAVSGGVIKQFPGMDANENLYNEDTYNKSRYFPFAGKKSNMLATMLIAFVFMIAWAVFFALLPMWTDISFNWSFLLVMSGFIPLFAYIIYMQCFVLTKELKCYIKDEEGLFYLVKITRAASTPIYTVDEVPYKLDLVGQDFEVAQDKYYAFNCVKNFNKGNKAWNWWSGGEYRVKPLGSLKLDKEGKKKSTFISTVNGHSRKITIDNGYKGIGAECDEIWNSIRVV